MENEKAKKLTEMIAGLPEHLQDVAANYIRGLVDGRSGKPWNRRRRKKPKRKPGDAEGIC